MSTNIEKLDANFAPVEVKDGLCWYDVQAIGVEGQGWPVAELQAPYDRLPARAEGTVREAVWNLSRHSAGLHARFRTDASQVAVRWSLLNDATMPHMPATGMSGIDLYTLDQGAWRWVGIGIPRAYPENESPLVSGLPARERDYLLYLPLYNGVTSVAIGIEEGAMLAPAAPWQGGAQPICFYGTSITHGGCACRPGMAYPAILGRRLHRPTINLGFSGNGNMDIELAALLTECDAALYVLDTLPNMSPQLVDERVQPFVRLLRERKPDVPIALVENIVYQRTLSDTPQPAHAAKNAALRNAWNALLADGVPGLHYIAGDHLLGDDWEGTVDGVHPTDVGFLRMADAFEPYLRQVLQN